MTQTESDVRKLLSRVLMVEAGKIRLHDNLNEALGMDYPALLQIKRYLEQQHGLKVTGRELEQLNTVNDLIRLLRVRHRLNTSPPPSR